MFSFVSIVGLVVLNAGIVHSFKPNAQRYFLKAPLSMGAGQINSKSLIASGLLAGMLSFPLNSFAIEQQYKLPPIDRKDTTRCELRSSSIGQANAARDKLYDLRECDLKGQTGEGKDMSGMIASKADFSGVSFKEAQISKAFARNSNFKKCDFTNAIVDRASFDGSDLEGALFVNSVLSGTTFSDANLKNTDFSDSYLGPYDLKNLCANPSLTGENPVTGKDTKESAGCL
eukprot:gene5706-11513_t